MEGEAIGMALARASELRSKIADCIERCSAGGRGGGGANGGEGAQEEEEDEAESLAGIRDALDSLERQLASLQALQQQQTYEQEATLSQINRSHMILLRKLKEYKGEDLEIINKALAFAGESIEDDEDLLFPPYPSHLPDFFVLDNLHCSSCINPKHKLSQNGTTCEILLGSQKLDESENTNTRNVEGKHGFKLSQFIGFVARSVVTFIGVVSLLSLAGVKSSIIRKGGRFKIQELFKKPADEEEKVSIQCPPGKVLVMEDGEHRCLVKERVEIPFESDVDAPNVSYGFG